MVPSSCTVKTQALSRGRTGKQASVLCSPSTAPRDIYRQVSSFSPAGFEPRHISFKHGVAAPICKLSSSSLILKISRPLSVQAASGPSRGWDEKRLAVLIDGDNAQSKTIESVLEEVGKWGTPKIKRVYADWSSPSSRTWKDCFFKYSLQPIQQIAYTTGKNATDMALIIDAMDLLHEGSVDGFCIVSSDSDFTPLVFRMRSAGALVLGFGHGHASKALVEACDHWFYTEALFMNWELKKASTSSDENEDEEDNEGGGPKQHPILSESVGKVAALSRSVRRQQENPPMVPCMSKEEILGDHKLMETLTASVTRHVDVESGWTELQDVVDEVQEAIPGFNIRNYGYKRWDVFLETTGLFETTTSYYSACFEKVLLVRSLDEGEEESLLESDMRVTKKDRVRLRKKWTRDKLLRNREFRDRVHFLVELLNFFKVEDGDNPYNGWTLLSDVANAVQGWEHNELDIAVYGFHDWREFVNVTGLFRMAMDEETGNLYVKHQTKLMNTFGDFEDEDEQNDNEETA